METQLKANKRKSMIASQKRINAEKAGQHPWASTGYTDLGQQATPIAEQEVLVNKESS